MFGAPSGLSAKKVLNIPSPPGLIIRALHTFRPLSSTISRLGDEIHSKTYPNRLFSWHLVLSAAEQRKNKSRLLSRLKFAIICVPSNGTWYQIVMVYLSDGYFIARGAASRWCPIQRGLRARSHETRGKEFRAISLGAFRAWTRQPPFNKRILAHPAMAAA